MTQVLREGCPPKHSSVSYSIESRIQLTLWREDVFADPSPSRILSLSLAQNTHDHLEYFSSPLLIFERYLRDEGWRQSSHMCGSAGGLSSSPGGVAQGLPYPCKHPWGCRVPLAGTVLQPHQPLQLFSCVPTATSLCGVSPSIPCTQPVCACRIPKQLPLSWEARVPSGWLR